MKRELNPPPWLGEAGVALVAVVLATVLGALVLQIGKADLSVPFEYQSDAQNAQMAIKGTLENGWYVHNAALNAPFGQDLRSYSAGAGEQLQWLGVKALGLFSSDSARVMNLYYLLTFALTALAAYLVMRAQRISRLVAVLGSALFATAPYHFLRGEVHLFLSGYFSVPLGLYLVAETWRGRSFWGRREGRFPLRDPVLAAVLAIVIATTHLYYALFTLGLIGIAAVVATPNLRLRTLFTRLFPAILIGVVLLVVQIPDIAYRSSHPANTAIARGAIESEQFGLKLAAMMLPTVGHRIGSFAHLRDRYDAAIPTQVRENDTQALGLLAALSVLAMLVLVLSRPFRRPGPVGEAIMPWAATAMSAFVVATVGGVSSVLAFLGFTDLRAWSRMSIFIAFCALMAAAIGADALRLRATRWRRGNVIAPALIVLVAVVAFFDQTNPGMAPDYATIKQWYGADGKLVSAVEASYPPGSQMFQLPYEPFPEAQPVGVLNPDVTPSDSARPYLHSKDLKWTFGGIKGEHHDWQARVSSAPLALLPPAIVSSGFTGLMVYRSGFADHGEGLNKSLQKLLGNPPVAAADDRFVFYDLRPYAARFFKQTPAPVRKELRRDTLNPIGFGGVGGFSGETETFAGRERRIEANAQAFVVNDQPRARRVVFRARFFPYDTDRATVSLRFPDGSEVLEPITARGKLIEHTFTLRPGSAQIEFAALAHPHPRLLYDSAPYYLRMQNIAIYDSVFDRVAKVDQAERPVSYGTPFRND